MVPPTNLGLATLILIFAIVTVVHYLLVRKTRSRLRERYHEVLQEQEAFLKSFGVTPFDDFSSFDFGNGRFSHVSPYPRSVEGDWRYVIYLMDSEAEDTATITHEICECSIGRVIENLLGLEKPLYLQRKINDKFWIRGKKKKYVVEHVMATLGEADDLTHKKLKQRLHEEDATFWLNRSEE